MQDLSSADALEDLLRLLEYPRRRRQPWVIGVLADLSGTPSKALPPLFNRRFVEISAANFDRVIAAARPRIRAHVDLPNGAKRQVELSFERLSDFEPMAVIERDDVLRRLFKRWREKLTESSGGSNAIAQELERKLSRWCSQVLHTSPFHDLEATWRGLRHLVDTIDPDSAVIRVLNVSKRELAQNLRRYAGVRWDQSPLFRKVYEEAYAQFGGLPYSLLVADMGFSHEADDCHLLQQLVYVSYASYAPLLTAAVPQLFGETHFSAVAGLSALRQRVRQPQYAKWNSVRENDLAWFVGVCLPRVLIRAPYRAQRTRGHAFPLDEQDAATPGGVWMNPAYAVASALINGTASGAVHGLARRLCAEEGAKAPVEAVFDSELCHELAEIGLMPITPAVWGGERLRIASFPPFAAPPSSAPVKQSETGSSLRDFDVTLRQTRTRQHLRVLLRDGVTHASLGQEAYRAWRARFGDGRESDRLPVQLALEATGLYVIVQDIADNGIQIEVFAGAYEGRRFGSIGARLV